MVRAVSVTLAGLLLLAPAMRAECPDEPQLPAFAARNEPAVAACPNIDPPLAPPAAADSDPLLQRIFRYTQLALQHRVTGLASYYSSFFDGRKTANGEVYRNRAYSAAHLTLPLGTWIEVTSRATGRKLRLRVNDRGPYVKKFCLDLSYAAAHYLGVDTAADRHVDIRIIALPGEDPLPEAADATAQVASAGQP